MLSWPENLHNNNKDILIMNIHMMHATTLKTSGTVSNKMTMFKQQCDEE